MSKKRSTTTRRTRSDTHERTVPLGYIGNPAPGPPPQTIEIPEAFRPSQASTPSENPSEGSQSSGERSDS